jgi:hypothetical protein
MHALEHNFEQLHIFQDLVISTVSTGNLIIKLFTKSFCFKIPISPLVHVTPPRLLLVAHFGHCTPISRTFTRYDAAQIS